MSFQFEFWHTYRDYPDKCYFSQHFSSGLELAVLYWFLDCYVAVEGDGAQVHDGCCWEQDIQKQPDRAQEVWKGPSGVWNKRILSTETFCDVTQLLNSSLQHHFIHFKWLTNPDISYVVFLETSSSNLLSQSFNTSINGLFLLFSHPCRISLIYFTLQILRSAASHLSSFFFFINLF